MNLELQLKMKLLDPSSGLSHARFANRLESHVHCISCRSANELTRSPLRIK